MFKRSPLSNGNHLVNGSLALCLLFMASSCDNNSNPPGMPAQEPIEQTVDDPLAGAPDVSDEVSLPAVWSSDNLTQPIKTVAVARGLGSLIAVGFENGEMQLLNFEGERVTEPADLDIAILADGQYGLVAGARLTIFAGVDGSGRLNAYIYGGDIEAPIALPLDIGSSGRVGGLCTGRPIDQSDGVMRLAFWTEGAVSRLQSGRLVEVGDNLIFLADEPVEAARPITACVLEPLGAKVFANPVTHAISLERNGRQTLLTLDKSSGLTLLGEENENTEVTIRDGITVRVPQIVTGFSGTGDARGGGYPGGLIVVAGAISTSEHRVVLVDPSDLTLTPFSAPLTCVLPSDQE